MIDVALDVQGVTAAIAQARQRIGPNVSHALLLAANIVAAQAREVHAYKDRTGALSNSIATDGVTGSFDAGDLAATIGAGAKHGLWVEFGAKPHKIKPKHRKALRWPVEGGFAFSRGVSHPGTKPYHFLRDALKAKFPDAQDAVSKAVTLSFAQAGFEIE